MHSSGSSLKHLSLQSCCRSKKRGPLVSRRRKRLKVGQLQLLLSENLLGCRKYNKYNWEEPIAVVFIMQVDFLGRCWQRISKPASTSADTSNKMTMFDFKLKIAKAVYVAIVGRDLFCEVRLKDHGLQSMFCMGKESQISSLRY